MSSEARIEIVRQDFCDGSGVRVDRTMPAQLIDHMTEVEWSQFCNRLDEALKPMSKSKRLALAISLGALLVFAAFLIFAFMAVTGLESNNFDSWFIFFILAPLVFMIGSCATAMAIRKGTRQARDAVIAVCEAESDKCPRLSFHVRFCYAGDYEPYMFTSSRGRYTTTVSYVSCCVCWPCGCMFAVHSRVALIARLE